MLLTLMNYGGTHGATCIDPVIPGLMQFQLQTECGEKHEALDRFFEKTDAVSPFVGLGLEGAQQLLWAIEPIYYLEESRDELIDLQGRLGFSGDDFLLRQSIATIVQEIDGDLSPAWNQVAEYWHSGELVSDLILTAAGGLN